MKDALKIFNTTDRIEEFLGERKKKNLLRALRPASFHREGKIRLKGKEYFDFSSNDYLGLANHPQLKKAAEEAIKELGVGASASRLLSGDLEIHHQLEEEIALFKGTEDALVFNSGYQANLGIISAFLKRPDAVFSDRLNHASIIDGILLSRAKLFRFRHCDSKHLELLLKKERSNFKEALIITETVFSMDGDKPSLKEFVDLKEKYNCIIMVDEAHATGIFGKSGGGIVQEQGLTDKIDLNLGTFSKALGSFGAYIACSKKMKDYLINTCRSFIYSTALPPPVIAANLASLKVIKEEPFRRKTLLDNVEYFRDSLKKIGLRVLGSSQIVPLNIGNTQDVIKLSEKLQNKHYWVLPIRPPTVERGGARLRFSLTYYHTKEVLEKLIKDIRESVHL